MLRVTHKRLGTGLMALAMILSQVMMPVSVYADQPDKEPKDDEPKKVYVCKYVGQPGVDERLKTGNEGLIEVSVNSIDKNSWDGVTVPAYFSDKQDRSYVLAYSVKGVPAPSVASCPAPDAGPQKITPPVVSTIEYCGPANDVHGVVSGDNYTVVDNKDGTFTLTASAGFVFTTNLKNVLTLTAPVDKNTACPRPTVCTPNPNVLSTNVDTNGWDVPTEAEYVNGGIKLNVSGNWDTTYISRAMVGPLADIGTGVDFSATPSQYVGIHVETDKGTLTFEKEGSYDGKWWSESDFGVASGMGYKTFDTLENIVAANPDVMTSLVRVLYTSPDAGSSVVTSVTVGCKTYTFNKVKTPPVKVCSAKNNLYYGEWTYDGKTFPMAGEGGDYNFAPNGLYLSTPAIEDDVFGLIDAGVTPLAQVDTMSYDVMRLEQSGGYASTLPAYILLVDTKGSGDVKDMKYFLYEPYNNDSARAATEGTFQTWDAYMNGEAKWYVSGTGQKLETWNALVSMFPDAEVLAYGFNQGTYNAETYSAIQNVKFDCATTVFTNKDEGGSGGEGETPTVPVTPVIPVVPTTPAVPATPVSVSGGQGNVLPEELPMTGENGSILFTWIALLAAILTYGSVYYLQPKKRFEQ